MSSDVDKGDAIVRVPERNCVTLADALEDPDVGVAVEAACKGSEIAGLTAWLVAERRRQKQRGGEGGQEEDELMLHKNLVCELDKRGSNSPLLWTDDEVTKLLRGTTVKQELPLRKAEVAKAYEALATHPSLDAVKLGFTYEAFADAFCAVLASALYLPSAECFALVPKISSLKRSSPGTCKLAIVDYDFESECVVACASENLEAGDAVSLPWGDGRNSCDIALTYGDLDDNGKDRDDFLMFSFSLVATDSLFTVKKGVLDELGFGADADFPVFEDRFPTQLLNFLRLSRLSDVGLLAKLNMEIDSVITPLNEYEVLQLMMGDTRDKMEGFENTGTIEEVQMLRDQLDTLTPREILAARVRLCEKRILNGTMNGVRTRLAPIRGVPTKGGQMKDPNSDIAEMFEEFEQLPQKIMSGKIFDGLFED